MAHTHTKARSVASTAPAARVLARLEGVRETAAGKWQARCPAHADRTPSLSIGETADGTILLFCHAGCSAAAVVDALGLELADLFDRPPTRQAPGQPLRHDYKALLQILAYEMRLVQVAAATMASGESLSEGDRRRLNVAAGRIHRLLEAAGVTS